ncbi:unnamed protein product [Symbiodinium sp. CCMP2592]|nr:unnamed protein product [Symbiodinium sp. CCMP2592]
MGLVAALLVLGLSASFGTASACNGNSGFCDLPLTQVTFAATHNAGAFSLDIPDLIDANVPGVDVNDALKCVYENHDKNFREQLDFGIRAFNLDLCSKETEPGVLFNCHGVPPAYGKPFTNSLETFTGWLRTNSEEVVIMWPGNLKIGSNAASQWEALMGNHFGEAGACLHVTATTNASAWSRRDQASCILVQGRPNENITLGHLVESNLRVVVWDFYWKEWVNNSYDPFVNPGATSESLLADFQKYGRGEKNVLPEAVLAFNVIGAPKLPSPAKFNQCKDVFCQIKEAEIMVDELELSCIKTLSRRYNKDLVQDDAQPHKYKAEETCPEFSCGCLGYISPLEVVHQELLTLGHSLHAVAIDYPGIGRSSVTDLARRMNEATLRHRLGSPELGADWWSCHRQPVLMAVAIPCSLVLLALVCCLLRRWYLRAQQRVEEKKRARKEAASARMQETGFMGATDHGYPGYPGQMQPSNPTWEMQVPQMAPTWPAQNQQPGWQLQGTVPQQIPPGVRVAPSAGAGLKQPFQKLHETE